MRSGVARSRPNTKPGKSRSFCSAQISSCRSGENICAGSPTATHPIGTVDSGGSTVRRCTTALMRTSLRRPMRAPLNTRVPVARKTSSATVAPEMLAVGPTRTCEPMCTG